MITVELEKEEAQLVINMLVTPQFVAVSNVVNKLAAALQAVPQAEGNNNETP